MRELKVCSHCGCPAEEKADGGQVYVQCSNTEGQTLPDNTWLPSCGMRTPQMGASLEYGAKDKVADVWNASIHDSPGTKGNPLPVPANIYYPELYYLEDDVKYLCYREYDSKGGHRPSGLVNHYFIIVED